MMPLALLAALLVSAPVHDEKLSVSRVEVKDDGIVWTVDVALQGLSLVIKLPADPLEITERQFQGLKGDVVAYLKTCMKVKIGDAFIEPEAGPMVPLYETFVATGEKYIAHARQQFRFPSATKMDEAVLSGAFFATKTDQHEAVVIISGYGAVRTFKRTGPFDLEISAARIHPTFWSTAGEFLRWGMHHIFIGYDHISFLLALLLMAKRLGEMVKVATSFTIAHSLTLLLSALDVVRLPQPVTESLIAASIVYVAAENYFVKEGRYRWVLTFAFGLIHGLGFSSVLRERLQEVDRIVLPVVSFNLGVELGQIAILLIAYPILTWIRKTPDPEKAERRQLLLVRIGSAPILLLGLAWMIDRIFQRNWMPF